MTRLARYGAMLVTVQREVEAFCEEFGAFRVESGGASGPHITVNGVDDPQKVDAVRDLANQYRARLTANVYELHLDAHMLGVLHELDGGETLGKLPWRWEAGAWPTQRAR